MVPRKNQINRILPALLLPFVACWLQWQFWPIFKPFVWFLFYPTVFFSSRLGGKSAGIASTVISALLVVYFFMPPQFSFAGKPVNNLYSVMVFLFMGILFSYTHDRLERANRRTVEAQEDARIANEQLQEARIGRLQAEQKLTKDHLHISEERYRSIFNHSPIAIGIGRRDDGRLVEVNDAWLQLYGFERDEVLGRTTSELDLYVSAVERDEIVAAIDGRGHILNREVKQRRKSGDVIDVQYSAEIIQLGGEPFLQVMVTDITERKSAEQAVREKNAEMERFIYMISHDLKSPLVTVKTFLGYLEQDMAGSDAARVTKDLDYMRGAADRMERMLDDLLELSRVGRRVNPPQACTFQELVQSARNMVAGRIAESGVEVRVGENDVPLYGDSSRLLEIWQNLLENACKFMGDQAHPMIEIGAEGCGRETVFFVRDNGIGIEPRCQEKIFGLFEKLDRQSEGTGLGLALVRRIVELNGGTIRVESQGAGQGSCFRFTLPGAAHTIVNGGGAT